MLAVASFILSKFSMYFSFCFYSILNRHLPLKIVSLCPCPLSLLLNPIPSCLPLSLLSLYLSYFLSLSQWKMQVSEKFVSTLLRPFEPNLRRPAAKIREKVKNFEPEMQHHHPSSSPKFKKGCPKFFFSSPLQQTAGY